MTPSDLAYLSAADTAAAIAARRLSPVEVATATLDRIARAQPVLNAFITVCREEALAAARAAEAAVMRGDTLGPLHGVPFTVKDLIATAGVRTTYGSHVHAANVPTADAITVARLKAAGAVLVGKTTTPEFGHKPLTEAPLFGRTLNAWDRSRTAGGSSGGAAVAVAAGLGPLAIASDRGGSTRIPAACNGVVGHKQTLGVVPDDAGPDAFGNWAYTTPTTRTVLDTALMLHVMAGPDPCDPHSLDRAVVDYPAAVRAPGDLAGLRVAWVPYLGNSLVARDVLDLCAAAARSLADFGAVVEEAAFDLPPTEPDWMLMTQAFWHARFWDLHKAHPGVISETLVRQMARAETQTAADLERAIFARTRIYRAVQAWFSRWDLVVMPTLSRTALPADHDLFQPITIDNQTADTVRRSWYPYTHPFNLAGNPACTVPCGLAADGLPVALQIVGPWHADARVLRAAALYEAAHPWSARRPPLPELDG
ncbi:MAG: amidase [Alphaproteobacteria bacterium]|nr:amidase [Alphaproteobacteria bacterium]